MNHSIYVWGAYSVAIAAMGLEVWALLKRRHLLRLRKPKSGTRP